MSDQNISSLVGNATEQNKLAQGPDWYNFDVGNEDENTEATETSISPSVGENLIYVQPENNASDSTKIPTIAVEQQLPVETQVTPVQGQGNLEQVSQISSSQKINPALYEAQIEVSVQESISTISDITGAKKTEDIFIEGVKAAHAGTTN